MKAVKSHPHIERPRRINSQITLSKYTAGLVLALVGLISAALMKGPIQLVSAETVALGWSHTGSLNTPRYYHTAVLLPDGKVLVAGGIGASSQLLDSSELYDPATGKWNATGSLNTPRSSYTASLLPDGKVLFAGGENYSGGHFQVLDSAELYDPATGTWNATGRLNGPRSVHAATLLKDGKVLIVGGYGSGPGAELYDPQNERWSVTGGLNTPRLYHTATLLKNGKVLVVGPADAFFAGDAYPLDTVELYDPDTGTWSFTGNLNTALDSHTATLLQNGKVLVLAGSSAELYDPDTGEWSSTGHLNRARIFHTATLLADGKVLVAGGYSLVANEFGYQFTLRSSELYDPDTETWSFAGNFDTARGYHTATLVTDGKLLLVGGLWSPGDGSTHSRLLDSVELGHNFAAVTPPKITMASVAGKKLIVAGENFDPDAVILINGEEQKTRNDDQNPGTTLIGKKAGKKIKPGDRLQVRNPDGPLSEEFIFTGS